MIALGIPFRGSVSGEFMINLVNMLSKLSTPHIVIYDNHFNLAVARDRIVKKALDSRVSKLIFIDTDVYPYKLVDGKVTYYPEALLSLYENYKDYKVVCVNHYSKLGHQNVYMFKTYNKVCLNKKCSDRIEFPVLEPLKLEPNTGLHKVDACGMGITMIDMDVFRSIEPPWFKFEQVYSNGVLYDMGEDVYFFKKLKENNIDVYVTTDILALHEIKLFVDVNGAGMLMPF